ncbi:ribonuclease P protein component [Salegentibacter sp. HM20]
MDQSFGKKEKLKSKIIIDRLFTEGRQLKKFPLKLVYLPLEQAGESQFQVAVSVPKKLIKTAVKRNRIKRLMREIYRKNKYLVDNEINKSYALMFIYISREESSYSQLEKCIRHIFKNFNEKETSDEK